MGLLSRLEALVNPLPQAYIDTTGHVPTGTAGGTEIAPTDDDRRVIAAMAFLAGHPGVPDHDTPGFPHERAAGR